MKIRNKSTTDYREVRYGKLLEVKAGAVVTLPPHDGNDLIARVPWIFELVKDEAGAASEAGRSSGATAERTAPAPRSRGRER